jgi:SAM-dependent methyltransferase
MTLERLIGNRQAAEVGSNHEAVKPTRASAYARWVRAGQDRSFAPVLDAVAELLPPPPLSVLDVGCGEGRLGKALIAVGYDVVGVDLDPVMVKLASEHQPSQVADATALPFEPQQFDAVVNVHVLMELEDVDRALAEMARVTRLGGKVVTVIEHPFASGRKVESYSRSQTYRWGMSFEGADLGIGGFHRPLAAYLLALDRAGLTFEALRETALPAFDPLSLVILARRSQPSG